MYPITPVLLSGGAGSRLWPLSNENKPKQFHALVSDKTMFGETLARVTAVDEMAFGPAIVVCGKGHEEVVTQEMAQAGQHNGLLILEPMPRNTGPALAAAALIQSETDPEGLMLVLPADHVITKPEALHQACKDAMAAAKSGKIITFGIKPTGPETGYGYIKQGNPIDANVFDVAAFREKPDLETAKSYIASGEYAWNAGIFFFKAAALIDALGQLAPAILDAAQNAIDRAQRHGQSIHLDGDAFGAAPNKSIDYAVMERTNSAAIIPVEMGWSDVGSFQSLYELGQKDNEGNSSQGACALFDARKSLVITQTVPVSVIGLSDIMVIVTATGVLVAPLDRAQEVRLASDAFKAKT